MSDLDRNKVISFHFISPPQPITVLLFHSDHGERPRALGLLDHSGLLPLFKLFLHTFLLPRVQRPGSESDRFVLARLELDLAPNSGGMAIVKLPSAHGLPVIYECPTAPSPSVQGRLIIWVLF